MSVAVHPPKPGLALRVGVTGHRLSRLNTGEMLRIDAQLGDVLDLLETALAGAHEAFADDYNDTAPLHYFVSALADGADTLAAKCAIARNWRLLAPLPFSRQSYAEDFSAEDLSEFDRLLSAADAIVELDGQRDGPALEERAYLQAGAVTVDQSDVVIAIWDGEEARGIGGTAMIKEEALTAGKPVIWINATSDTPPVLLGADNRQKLFDAEAARRHICRIVAPPSAGEIEHEFSGRDTHALHAYRSYIGEKQHSINYGSFFQFWEKVFAGKWPFSITLKARSPAAEIQTARKNTIADQVGASSRDKQVFEEIIIPRFAWADHLAIHYGNLYRSSYFFNYLFAAIAVFLALFDLVAGEYGFGDKTLWISIEVSLIILILTVTTLGKRQRWHEKWIDYRQLAEEMRQYRLYFITLGRDTGDAELSQGEGAEAAGWVDWYFAATRREAGMSSTNFAPDQIRLISRVILEEEIRPQIAYHDRKAGILHAMEHRLHHLGEYAFAATLFVCLCYLGLAFLAAELGAGKETLAATTIETSAPYNVTEGGYGAAEKAKDPCAQTGADADGFGAKKAGLKKWAKCTKYEIKGIVTMLTGFLPALGAAFFGIRVQGEFGSTAERSHATAAQLKAIALRFEELEESANPRLQILRYRVEEAARAMLMENMDWRLLYISKPLNLPG